MAESIDGKLSELMDSRTSKTITTEKLKALGWWECQGSMMRGWRDPLKSMEMTPDSGVVWMPIYIGAGEPYTCSTEEFGEVDYWCIEDKDGEEINRLAGFQVVTPTYDELIDELRNA